MVASFYVQNETKNPFKIIFPHLWYVKDLSSSHKQSYDVIEGLFNWPDLDEMKDLLNPEINFLLYEDDEIDCAIYEDGYGKRFELSERKESDEMKFLYEMRIKRGTLFLTSCFI